MTEDQQDAIATALALKCLLICLSREANSQNAVSQAKRLALTHTAKLQRNGSDLDPSDLDGIHRIIEDLFQMVS